MTTPARANFDALLHTAESGDVTAQYEAAITFFRGGSLESYKKSFEWAQKAANKNNVDAQYLLGTFYHAGFDVVPIDTKESVKWFKKAAEKGHAASQCSLGLCYRDGDGVIPDQKDSENWLQKSAAQNYPYAVLNVIFGKVQGGKFTEEDAVKAFQTLQNEAQEGDPSAIFRVGVCYTQSKGVSQDYPKAISFLQKAAGEGHALALNNLGMRYVKGDGVQKDLVKAVELFRKASSQNNANAYNNLAVRYLKGEAVPQNIELAQQYFKKAADLGNIQSLMNLGDSYRNGDRFRKNLRKAKYWYEIASKYGNSYSQQQIDSQNFKAELQKEIDDANRRWTVIRLFFIASIKNKNTECPAKSVPVEILKIIVRYADL